MVLAISSLGELQIIPSWCMVLSQSDTPSRCKNYAQQLAISQPVFISVSDLLQTTRVRYLFDGQNRCLEDILVSLTNADVHRSIRFTGNRAVQFRLQVSAPWRGDTQDHG